MVDPIPIYFDIDIFRAMISWSIMTYLPKTSKIRLEINVCSSFATSNNNSVQAPLQSVTTGYAIQVLRIKQFSNQWIHTRIELAQNSEHKSDPMLTCCHDAATNRRVSSEFFAFCSARRDCRSLPFARLLNSTDFDGSVGYFLWQNVMSLFTDCRYFLVASSFMMWATLFV